MRYWAQFYVKRGEGYAEAMGSDQVFEMDRRFARRTMEAKASEICRARGYAGWRLARGNSYRTPFYLNAAVRAG